MTGPFARAEQLIADGKYQEAIRFCQLQLAKSPRCVTLRLLLARALLAEGSREAAVRELRDCLRVDPASLEARALLAALSPPERAAPRRPHGSREVPRGLPTTPPASPPVRVVPSALPRIAAVRPTATAGPASPPVARAASPAPAPTATTPPMARVVAVPGTPPIATAAAVAEPTPALYEEAPPRPAPHLHLVDADEPTQVRRPMGREFLSRPVAAPVPAPQLSPVTPAVEAPRWQRPFPMEGRPSGGAWRYWLLGGILLAGGAALWRHSTRAVAPPPVAAVATIKPKLAPLPPPPKTDDQAEIEALLHDVWVHPLNGPERRMPLRDSRIFGAERLGDRPSECRGGHCGVDLSGAVGEPVYAVHDGVVERVRRDANPDHGGHYVRLSHRGGTISSWYFHLSGIPKQLEHGVAVKAGQVVGWVGKSGVKHSVQHLHFAITVQRPNGEGMRYVDPEPLLAFWPLRDPATKEGGRLRLSTDAEPGLAIGFTRHQRRRRPSAQPQLPRVSPPVEVLDPDSGEVPDPDGAAAEENTPTAAIAPAATGTAPALAPAPSAAGSTPKAVTASPTPTPTVSATPTRPSTASATTAPNVPRVAAQVGHTP